MQDHYRRHLMTLGLGTAIAYFSSLGSTGIGLSSAEASDPPIAGEQTEATMTPTPSNLAPLNPGLVQPQVMAQSLPEAQSMPTPREPNADSSPQVTDEPVTEPLEPAVDLPAEDAATPSRSMPTLDPNEEPVPLEPGEGTTAPLNQEDSPVTPSLPDQVPLDPIDPDASLPDYLTPSGNPLQLPTQPEEVEIVGTQPLTLEQTVEVAYQNNEDLQIALLELQQARYQLEEAQAALYPTLDLEATLQSGNQASIGDLAIGSDNVSTALNGDLTLNYDLGLSGARAARIRAAEEAVRNAQLEVERRRAQLRLDTIGEYYSLQEAIERIQINQAFLDEAERNLRDAALREEVGVGTRFDVLRAEVQVANARQNVILAQSQRDIAQRQLSRRLSVPPSISLTTVPVSIAGTWPLTLEESIVLAFQNRAELEQVLTQRAIAEEQRQIALAETRPELGLFANIGAQQVLSGGRTGFDEGFNVGAQFRWRLLDGGASIAAARQREQDIAIAETQFAETRNGIRLEVEQAYFQLEANRENIDTAQLAVQQAEEAVELANLRFNAGVGTQLDVLSATSELADARGNLITAILDYNRSLAALERAITNLAAGNLGD